MSGAVWRASGGLVDRLKTGHKLCLNTLCQRVFYFVSCVFLLLISVGYGGSGHKDTTDTAKNKEPGKRLKITMTFS